MNYEMTPRIRTIKEGHFFWMNNQIFEIVCGKNKPYLILIYAYLCRMANDKQFCFPSQERIAAETGISLRKVKGVIRDLSSLHLIFIKKSHYRNKTRNKYLLVHPTEWIKHSAPGALRSVHSVHPNKTYRNKKEYITQDEIRSGMTDLVRKMSIAGRINGP